MESTESPDGLRIQPAYLRPKAAAAYCGISLRTLWAWVKEGKLRQPYRPSLTVALFAPTRLREDIARIGGDQ
jgi:predicted site-specific integrase-resolvase